jgi:hypothetical protein
MRTNSFRRFVRGSSAGPEWLRQVRRGTFRGCACFALAFVVCSASLAANEIGFSASDQTTLNDLLQLILSRGSSSGGEGSFSAGEGSPTLFGSDQDPGQFLRLLSSTEPTGRMVGSGQPQFPQFFGAGSDSHDRPVAVISDPRWPGTSAPRLSGMSDPGLLGMSDPGLLAASDLGVLGPSGDELLETPEPSSLVLSLIGLWAVGGILRRRAQSQRSGQKARL